MAQYAEYKNSDGIWQHFLNVGWNNCVIKTCNACCVCL